MNSSLGIININTEAIHTEGLDDEVVFSVPSSKVVTIA